MKGKQEKIAQILQSFGQTIEKRSCENCGNLHCANSIVAFYYDECVQDNFTKYWRPKTKNLATVKEIGDKK